MEGKGSRSVAQVGERGGSEDTEGEEGELVARRGRSRAEPVASTVGWRVRHGVRRGEGRVEWVITGAQRGEACNQPALRKECSSSSHVITGI